MRCSSCLWGLWMIVVKMQAFGKDLFVHTYIYTFIHIYIYIHCVVDCSGSLELGLERGEKFRDLSEMRLDSQTDGLMDG